MLGGLATPEADGITYIKRNKKLKVGDLVKVSITNADIYDLFGEIVSIG